MNPQSTKSMFTIPTFLLNLQRCLIGLLGLSWLLMLSITGVGLSYFVSFDRWGVWLSFGGGMLLLGALAVGFGIRILRQEVARQWQAIEFDREKSTPEGSVEDTNSFYKDKIKPASESVPASLDPTEAKKIDLAPEAGRQTQSGPLASPDLELTRLKETEAALIERNRELTILRAAGVAITSSLDFRYVLDTVAQEMSRLAGVESCTIFEWHQAEDALSRMAKYDSSGWWSAETLAQVRQVTNYPVTKGVLKEQIPEQMVISQPYLDPAELAYMQTANIKTRLIVPMTFQQRVIGLVELEDSQVERTFTFQEISLVKLLANQAGSAIENARLYQQAQQEIGERQRAEAALKEERALLAQRVQERTAELSKANAELARAARLKDEFLANMSHELRTPLNVIIGSTEILQQEVFGDLNEKQQRYMGNVHESGTHLLSLITDILDLSKIEAGRLEVTVAPLTVRPACEASLRLVKQLAHKKQLKVSLEVDDKVETLTADERRLKQILVNLLSNSIKFTPEGGQIGLEVAGDVAGQAVRFTVWDTGVGISPEDLAQLFRPFVQVDSKLSRQQQGTGLGLCMVSRLAELHGGGVSVESEVGVGSRFTVSLPWSEAPETALDAEENRDADAGPPEVVKSSKPLSPRSEEGASPLILMAEDNEQNIEMLSGFLQAQGYRLIIARNGSEAIERAKEEKPDLILMDIQMPGMDGLEATRHLRADAALAQIPIIALTALVMPNDRERCLQAGLDDYLSKPISPEGLVKTIETYLNGKW